MSTSRLVRKNVRNSVKAVARSIGFDIVRNAADAPPPEYPPDFEPHHISIIEAVKNHTMTSRERIFSVVDSVHYITRRNIPGSIVECGVWRGGSSMAMALTLKSLGVHDRDLYLFDTFEGMPRPLDVDVDMLGNSATEIWKDTQLGEDSSDFCRATLPDVKAAMASTGYDKQKVHFHQGKVELTIPAAAPDQIALLRLDTDWYESTRHELEHLYPRLSPGGILIIDDYGHWSGARKATDEYIEKYAPSLFLARIDYTGRIAVKTA
jgi:O-methyltransferase